jgi:hypothetical protein
MAKGLFDRLICLHANRPMLQHAKRLQEYYGIAADSTSAYPWGDLPRKYLGGKYRRLTKGCLANVDLDTRHGNPDSVDRIDQGSAKESYERLS